MGSSRQRDIRRDAILLGGLIAIAAALILYLVMNGGGDATSETAPGGSPAAAAVEPGTAAPQGDQVERHQPNDPLALGRVDAPVTMVMFSDYRCPFCAKFSRDTEPELVARYVDQGTLRIEWRDFPIFGDQSMLAARAGRAAAAQGRFWEFTRAVFAAAPERGHANLDEQALIGFARQAGVADIEGFTTAMRGTAFDAAINADLAQGNRIGVPSTPAFLINDVPFLGAQPTEEFVRAIDAAVGAL
ncbi:thioredoxin domain-containing protein [Mycolicibacterium boenickei]